MPKNLITHHKETQNIYDITDFLISFQEFDVNRGIRFFKYAVKRKLGKVAIVLSEML